MLGVAWVAVVAVVLGPPDRIDPPDTVPPDTVPLDEVLEVSSGATCLDHDRVVRHISGWLGGTTVDGSLHLRLDGDEQDARRATLTLTRFEEV